MYGLTLNVTISKVMDEYNSLLIELYIRPLAFIDPEKSELLGTFFY